MIRTGLRWSTSIPIGNIMSVESVFEKPPGNKGISIALLGAPNVLIELNSEESVTGLYGIRKKVESLYLYVDNGEAFITHINRQRRK